MLSDGSSASDRERRIKRRFTIEQDVRYKMLYGQRIAETHVDAALHLLRTEPRVDGATDVVRRDHALGVGDGLGADAGRGVLAQIHALEELPCYHTEDLESALLLYFHQYLFKIFRARYSTYFG